MALLGGNEYLVQQLLDRLLDAGFTTAQVISFMLVKMSLVAILIFVIFGHILTLAPFSTKKLN